MNGIINCAFINNPNCMKNFSLLIVLLLLATCQKGDDFDKAEVRTSAYEVQGDSLLLRGEIVSLGDSKVIEYGFLLDNTEQPDVFSARKIVCQYLSETGSFSAMILNDFSTDSTFYLRSFIETSLDYIYGNELNFEGSGKYEASISDFTPRQGVTGDYVKIIGEDFGHDPTKIQIYFGSLQAELQSLSETSLNVKVPAYELSHDCFITVVTHTDTAVSQ